MSISTSNSRGAIVTPVIDYEPPAVGYPASSAPSSYAPPRPPALHRPASRTRHLHAIRRPDDQPSEAVPSEWLRLAAAFTDAALRSILEVMDRRRPAVQLRPLLAGGLADTVASFTRTAPERDAAAVLRRVRLQPVLDGADGREPAYEASASYSRGSRVHALACRVERVATPRGEHWQVVALHIG